MALDDGLIEFMMLSCHPSKALKHPKLLLMSTLKIVHVVEALGGGVYTYFKNLTQVLCEAPDLEVTVIYSGNRDEINNDQVASDFHPKTRLICISMHREIRFKEDFKAFKALKTTLKQIEPDVLHLHSSKGGILGRFAYLFSPRLKAKLFYTPHGFSFLRKDISSLKRHLFFSIEFLSQKLTGGTLIACGDTELRYAKKIGPALLVRNGIQQLGLTNFEKQHRPQIKCIGTLGRITYARNPAYFNQLALNHPELEFLWIGDGELRHQLTAPNITVTGWFNHYEQGLQKLEVLDLYLQTSLWEGLPIALLEASAREIPIVATNIIGNKDIVAAGKTGFLFDAEYEFDQILKKSKNQSTRIALGNAAKKRTAILFNSAVNFQKLIRLYQA